MNAYVITHSSTYESRAEAVGSWLAEQGMKVTWIYADFDHRELRNVYRQTPDHVYLHMTPYTSNLSPKRLQSIRQFAGQVEKYLTGREADLLYFMVPANSFVPAAERLKKRTGARIVLDIIDLWPESLPLARGKALPPLYAWKQLRDRHIGCADLIFSECSLYQKLLSLPEKKTQTLYWFQEKAGPSETEGAALSAIESAQWDDSETRDDGSLHIAYIGAINYIIDIEGIVRLLQAIQKRRPVVLHIIGYGKRKEAFLNALDEACIQSEDYGAVYEEEEKEKIFQQCRFGLNMMIPQVKVGLTMKSLDYLAHGLPLLNSIEGDTQELIEEYDAGIQSPREDPECVVSRILAMADDPLAGRDARRLFEEKFTKAQFRESLAQALRPLLPAGKGTAAFAEYPTGRESSSASQIDNTAGEQHIPAISVAMTACNGEPYIAAQLDSILPQLGEDDEVLVSVDPSTDRTFEILFEYAARDARIRILEGPGEGVIRNVENVLQNCSGRKIFLADQDDIWLPDKVEKVSKMLEQHTLVLHDARIVDAELAEIESSYMKWRRSRKGTVANIRKNSYIGCCMAFRRELLQHALPFPDDLPMHDQWIGLLAEKYGDVRLLRVPLLLYRRHGDNATRRSHANPAQMLRWRAAITRDVLRR